MRIIKQGNTLCVCAFVYVCVFLEASLLQLKFYKIDLTIP